MQDLKAFKNLNLLTQTHTHTHYIPSPFSDFGQIIVSVANSAYILCCDTAEVALTANSS